MKENDTMINDVCNFKRHRKKEFSNILILVIYRFYLVCLKYIELLFDVRACYLLQDRFLRVRSIGLTSNIHSSSSHVIIIKTDSLLGICRLMIQLVSITKACQATNHTCGKDILILPLIIYLRVKTERRKDLVCSVPE